jgi:hypothetical protein
MVSLYALDQIGSSLEVVFLGSLKKATTYHRARSL